MILYTKFSILSRSILRFAIKKPCETNPTGLKTGGFLCFVFINRFVSSCDLYAVVVYIQFRKVVGVYPQRHYAYVLPPLLSTQAPTASPTSTLILSRSAQGIARLACYTPKLYELYAAQPLLLYSISFLLSPRKCLQVWCTIL